MTTSSSQRGRIRWLPAPAAFCALLVAGGCGGSASSPRPTAPVETAPAGVATTERAAPTIDEARAFMETVNAELLPLWTEASRVAWVKATYITHDTEQLEALMNERVLEYTTRRIKEAERYSELALPDDLARQFYLLKYLASAPAPDDASKRAELAKIFTTLESTYGTGKVCSPKLKGKGRDPKATCLDLGDLSEILMNSRDEKLLLEVWKGWRAVSRPMRPLYERLVTLGNEGARDLGFADMAEIWKGRYDMSAAAFDAEVERLWTQVEPLYQVLHCFVRSRLRRHYGDASFSEDGLIPAHLLGNMWAQEWTGIYPLVEPYPGKGLPSLTQRLKAKGYVPTVKGARDPSAVEDKKGMVELAERFFTSLGMDPLPETFWQRSLFVQPDDREVVCHASAWDVDYAGDLRIKMCIRVTEEDLVTLHHELGHNYYFHYYDHLPLLFRGGANDGFHEGIGDTLSLSVTPSYLADVGLYDRVPKNREAQINDLMRRALDAIAFLPFGLLVDQWRFRVFDGKTPPGEYNAAWWRLRSKYQGVAAPIPRSEEDFDPGAKYHVAANVPYTRYFIARILQYQFHRALCRAAGHTGPLHECSIYGKKDAGKKLVAMMQMGQSQPWPNALEALSGERAMDATAMVDYYAPLERWLREATKGERCGW